MYLSRLEQSDNLLCLGLDPVPERMPEGMGAGEFLGTLLSKAKEAGLLPSTLKPNLAYFEQYGWQGVKLLEELVKEWSEDCLIILDAKRGDIGRSSDAYAKTMFETYGGDAVTLHPWMGPDSVEPFLKYAPNSGAYLLLRTSNPGGEVLQKDSWLSLLRKADLFDPSGELGFVVGATRPSDLQTVVTTDPRNRPLLIPGVGTQGGKSEEVLSILRECPEPRRHRVNVSSVILYAHQGSALGFPDANLKALESYNKALQL